jgi:alpha-D-ribose 1-methylphosphonate 5-triphosphate synthase subunit PhnH
MSAVPFPGLRDPVHDAQRCFRAALQALARPGTLHDVGAPIAGLPLGAAMAQLLLTLTDEATPVWWQQPRPELAGWLRFHTGARSTDRGRDASFAAVPEARALDFLEVFALGSLAAPERSCTLLVEVPSLDGGPAMHAHGPGIPGGRPLRIDGLHPAFWSAWQANHAVFPQGVDLFFTCGSQFVGLPRTTRISRLEEV